MSALESMLEGDEPFVRELADMQGEHEAERFVDQFNNACLHMDGFERFIARMDTTGVFYAPLNNLSWYYDH